ALLEASFIPFKFNFRGVGGSEGEYGEGKDEQEDVSAAIYFVAGDREVDAARMGLAGYSAGAAFAFPVGVTDARVKALAAISLPLNMFDFEAIKNSPKAKCLIIGSQDDLIPVERFREVCSGMAAPAECTVISGADHFWQGLEPGLADKVVAFFTCFLLPEAK
ncbi:MAG: dienelactone hydrolase family protein, partial [Dehalococcoidales bacterium]|nr:dienelactone hydrolase family protein [Dehalococcoidales bacterium]